MSAIYSWLLESAAMPAVSRLTSSRFWPNYRRMLRLERAPLPELLDLQWRRFTDLLRHACEHVPLQRQLMDQARVKPADIDSPEKLPVVPVLTKALIQRNFPDRVTAENSNRADWKYVSTRGTANRLMAIHDFAKRDAVRAAAVRAMRLSGGYRLGNVSAEIPPNICNIVCGDEGQELEGVLPHLWQMLKTRRLTDARAVSDLRGLVERGWIFRRRTYPPFGGQGTALPDDRLEDYVRRIRRDRPRILKALPTYLLQIARHVQRRGLPPLPVGAVKPMGGSVSPAMKQVIERAFAGAYREDYGSAEFGDMACDCARGDGLHLFMDLFLIEVVRQGKPAAEGELGKILVTDLSNYAMPFIRYEIGDVGRLFTSPCGCGRASHRMVVEGRLQDTIVTDSGQTFTSDRFMDYFYEQPGIEDFQVVENKPGKIDLMIVPSNGSPPRPEEVARGLSAFLGGGVEVKVYPAKTIRPEESGKFRFVKSASYERLG